MTAAELKEKGKEIQEVSVTMSFKFPVSMRSRIEVLSEDTGRSMTDIVIKSLEEFFNVSK